jgi:hypothetical protein
MKVAIVATEPPYSEHETTLTVDADRNIVIPYGYVRVLSSNAKRGNLLRQFKGYGFSVKPTQQIQVGPNQLVKLEHSPLLGAVEMRAVLSHSSILFTYILTIIFWGGLIILARSVFQFIYFGKQWWLKI